MHSETLRVALRFAMILVVMFQAIEIYGWIRGTRLVNRKQKVLRALSGGFILTILAMILIGDSAARAYHPLAAVGWWFVCFSLAVAVVLMALADLKQVALRFGEERKQSFEALRSADCADEADSTDDG